MQLFRPGISDVPAGVMDKDVIQRRLLKVHTEDLDALFLETIHDDRKTVRAIGVNGDRQPLGRSLDIHDRFEAPQHVLGGLVVTVSR